MQKIKLSEQDKEALLHAKKIIEENFDDVPSLRSLCRRLGINEDKFKKGFKQLFGIPPYTYHQQIKIEYAKKLLFDTDQPVYEIAWSLGYQHSSNFCIEFKKATGCSPFQYRVQQNTCS